MRKKNTVLRNNTAFARIHSSFFPFRSELNAKSKELHLQISGDERSSEGGCRAGAEGAALLSGRGHPAALMGPGEAEKPFPETTPVFPRQCLLESPFQL